MDNILTTLTVGNGGFEGSESHQTDLVEQLFNPDNFLQAIDIMQDNIDENKPKAFLNYILFNEDMEVVTEFTGSFQVDGNGTWSTIGTPEPMDIPENGYLAVYVSTQTQIECDGCEASASDVYFDYFSIRFTRGNLKEETHYYPFGLPMATSAAADFMPNRHRYQSNEYRKEAGLNWMDFHARQYDPQIGRFLSVDPLADAGGQQVFSPYAAMANNPVSRIDPLGLQSVGGDGIVVWGTRLDERRGMQVGSSFFTNMELSLRLAEARAAAWNDLIMIYQGMRPSMSPLAYSMEFVKVGAKNYPKFSTVPVPLPPSSGKSYQSPGGGWYGNGGIANWWFSGFAFGAEKFIPGSFRLNNGAYNGYKISPKYYSSGWSGGSRARITTYKVGRLGGLLGKVSLLGGMALDVGGVWNYYNDPESKNVVHPAKATLNTGMGIYGAWISGPAGLLYFGIDVFHPGGWQGFLDEMGKMNVELQEVYGPNFRLIPFGPK